MTDHLASALPLHEFPRETISAGSELHHYGILDASKDSLHKPLWVSDRFEKALEYIGFGVRAPRYTKLVTYKPFEIVDLTGVSLMEVAEEGFIDHPDWYRRLAAYLVKNRVLGIVYAEREIFLPEPNQVIRQMESRPS